jgi:addiction module RelE/StbE family toxin
MKITFHRGFKKSYEKAPARVRGQFDERILLFEENPHHSVLRNHPLTGKRHGQRSINVTGDWRAIYFWRDEETAVFLDLDTHSNLYG